MLEASPRLATSEESQGRGTVTFGKYTFTITPNHFSPELIHQLKNSYDELGHAAIGSIQQIIQRNKEAAKIASASPCIYTTDYYSILRDYRHEDPALEKLWAQTSTIPEWVDWEQLRRGQDFFYRYLIGNLTGYAHQGFIAETSVAESTAEVLARSGGFSTKVLLRRLLETVQFLSRVTYSIEGIQPGGDGFATMIRVRLIHSMVRHRILQLCKERDDYFDMQRLGVPLSDLDQIHGITVASMSHALMHLPHFGVYVSKQEMGDYIALWRWIAWVQGVPDSFFSSTEKTLVSRESVLLYEMRITPRAQTLSYNFIQSVTDVAPSNVSVGLVEAMSRHLNGDELCDALGLGKPGVLAQASAKGLSWLILTLAWLQWSLPSFDRWMVSYWRRTLHNNFGADEKLANSSLGQHYMPRHGKLTKKESHGRRVSRSLSSIFLLSRPIDRFLFGYFIAGCMAMLVGSGTAWFGLRRAYSACYSGQ